jgi:hypothetical protein
MPLLLWLFGTAAVVTVAYKAGKKKAETKPL